MAGKVSRPYTASHISSEVHQLIVDLAPLRLLTGELLLQEDNAGLQLCGQGPLPQLDGAPCLASGGGKVSQGNGLLLLPLLKLLLLPLKLPNLQPQCGLLSLQGLHPVFIAASPGTDISMHNLHGQ